MEHLNITGIFSRISIGNEVKIPQCLKQYTSATSYFDLMVHMLVHIFHGLIKIILCIY